MAYSFLFCVDTSDSTIPKCLIYSDFKEFCLKLELWCDFYINILCTYFYFSNKFLLLFIIGQLISVIV